MSINPQKQAELGTLAKKINNTFNDDEIYYLISMLSKDRVLLESRRQVATGAYTTPQKDCPYCGKPL